MKRIVLGVVVGLFLLDVFILAYPTFADSQVDEIAKELMCQCGCGKLLDVCEMETAKQMKDLIAQKLEAGWNKKRIVEYLVTQYGEKVLAAPTKRGFNLTAWVTPFLGLLAGGGLIWAIVVSWVKRRNATVTVETDKAAVEELEKRYGAQLERELRELE